VYPDALCVTSGASQSFFNILTFFTGPKTRFLIENPTYFLALKMLQDHGIDLEDVLKVPVDEQGILVDQMDQMLGQLSLNQDSSQTRSQASERKRFPYLLFLVSTYSNPTGTTLSDERRKRLVQLARKYDVLVVSDDVYQLLNFDHELPPPRLVAYDLETLDQTSDQYGNVISNCSFSKLFAPGMRLGWIEAGPGIIRQLKSSGLLYSGGCSNHLGANVMNSVIQSGDLKKHLDEIRNEYQKRRDVMIKVLSEKLNPEKTRFCVPKGGYFIWLEFKDKSVDTLELLNALQGKGEYRGVQADEKVSFTPGNSFSVDQSHGHCLRLSFGMYKQDDLIKGCERLCKVLNRV
jgi:DNA-binding transcriptional MocR family regulator